jgi:YVTN family beta-propeller protein
MRAKRTTTGLCERSGWRPFWLCVALTTGLIVVARCPARGAEYAYVTHETDSALVTIDTATDTVVDAARLSPGYWDMAVSRDGTTAYVLDIQERRTSSQLSGCVAVLDLATRTVTERIPVGLAAQRLAISGNGRYLFVTGLPNVEIDLVEHSVTPLLTQLPVPWYTALIPSHLAVTDDGRYVYIVGGFVLAELVRLDTTTGAVELRDFEPFSPTRIALDPSGTYVFLIGNSRLVVLDAKSLNVILESFIAPIVDWHFNDLVVAPGGSPLYVLANQGLLVVDPHSGEVLTQLAIPSDRLAMTPDGGELYLTDTIHGNVRVVDTKTFAVTATVHVGPGALGVASAPDGRSVLVAARDGVYAIETATHQVSALVPGVVDPNGVAALPDGSKLYIAGYRSDNVGVFDTATHSLTRSIPIGRLPIGVAVSPDGTRAYVTNFYADGRVFVIDTATDTLIDSILLPNGAWGLAVTPDGRRLFVAGYWSQELSVIDTATDTVVQRIIGIAAAPEGIAISSDGTFGLVGGDEKILIIGQLDGVPTVTGSVDFDFDLGAATPCSIAIRRDGRRAYAADDSSGYLFAIDPIERT